MKYIIETQELLDDAGQLLKRINCPLTKEWKDLQYKDETDLCRYCVSCESDVFDISNSNDEEVRGLVKYHPSSCFYATANSGIEFVQGESDVGDDAEDESFGLTECAPAKKYRLIKTARNVTQMNKGVRDGYKLILRSTLPNPDMKQNCWPGFDKDGFIYADDGSVGNSAGAYIELASFFNPYRSSLPFAAYLIPNDLENDERVYIPDLIEDLVGMHFAPSGNFRSIDGYAIWKDNDLVLEPIELLELV